MGRGWGGAGDLTAALQWPECGLNADGHRKFQEPAHAQPQAAFATGHARGLCTGAIPARERPSTSATASGRGQHHPRHGVAVGHMQCHCHAVAGTRCCVCAWYMRCGIRPGRGGMASGCAGRGALRCTWRCPSCAMEERSTLCSS